MQMTWFLVRNVPAKGRLRRAACADSRGEVVCSALSLLESAQVGVGSPSKPIRARKPQVAPRQHRSIFAPCDGLPLAWQPQARRVLFANILLVSADNGL